MAFDWRGETIWTSLDDDQKWAAMSLLEVGKDKPDQARNVAHAIFNRANLRNEAVGKHIETNKTKGGYGWYQPLYEPNQLKALPGILESQNFQNMVDYVKQVRQGGIDDPTGGATRYLVPGKTMEKLSNGVSYSEKDGGYRGNSKKYHSWPGWTGYNPKTQEYKNNTLTDGVHSFVVPDEDINYAKAKGKTLNWATVKPQSDVYTPSDLEADLAPSKSNTFQAGLATVPTGGDNQAVPDGVPPGIGPADPEPASNDQLPQSAQYDGQDPVAERQYNRAHPQGGPDRNWENFDTGEPTITGKTLLQPLRTGSAEEAYKSFESRYPHQTTWQEAWDATVATSPFVNSAQNIGQQFNPLMGVTEPGFNVVEKDLVPYQEFEWDYLLGSPNSTILNLRKKELDERRKGMEVWNKTSWAQYLGLGTASLIPDIAAAVGLTYAAGPAGTYAAIAARIKTGTRAYRVAHAAAAGFAATGVEMYAHRKAGVVSTEAAIGFTALGGVLNAAFLSKTRPNKITQGAVEGAEDLADSIKTKGRVPDEAPSPREHDPQLEADLSGAPGRVKVDTDNSPQVFRTYSSTTPESALKHFDADMGTLGMAFKAAAAVGTKSKQAMKVARMAFERQGHRLQELETVYFSIPKKLSDVNAAMEHGLLTAFKDIESVATAARLARGTVRVIQMNLPKGTKLIRTSDFTQMAEATDGLHPGQVMFGDGVIKMNNKTRKHTFNKGDKGGIPFEVEKASFAPDKKRMGKPVFPIAYAKSTGERLDNDVLAALNKDLVENGMDAQALKYGASAGAARVDPLQYKLRDMTNEAKHILEDLSLGKNGVNEAQEKEGFFNMSWGIARVQLLLSSDNPLIRNMAPRMMGGALKLSPKQVKAGVTRPVAADDVKRFLTDVYENKLLTASKTGMREFWKEITEMAKKGGHKRPSWLDAEEAFNGATTDYQRLVAEGINPTETFDSVKKFAAKLDEITDELRGYMADPGSAVGRPGAFEPIADFDQIATKRGYMPRQWSDSMIRNVQATFGDSALFDFLHFQFMHTLRESTLTPSAVRNIAAGMADTITLAKGGWHSWVDAAFGRGNPQDLIATLRNSGVDLSEDDMATLLQYLSNGVRKSGSDKKTAGTNTFYKAMLDENLGVPLRRKDNASALQEVKLNDFVENNATHLIRNYIHKNSGRIGMGSMEIPHPSKPGEMLVQGIRNDDDWQKLMQVTRDVEIHMPKSARGDIAFASNERILKNWYEYMTHSYPHKTWAAVRFAKMMVNFSMLGKAGFPQVAENINAIDHAGISALFRLEPFTAALNGLKNAFKGANRGGGDMEFTSMLARQLHDGMGLGTEMNRMSGASKFEEAASTFSGPQGRTMGQKVGRNMMHGMEQAQNFILNSSGLVPMTSHSTIRTAEAMHDQTWKLAQKYATSADVPRMHMKIFADMGLNEADVDTVLKMYRDPNVVVPSGSYFKPVQQVNRMSGDNFNPDVFFRLENGFVRAATTAIQSNKWGMMPPGFDHPVMGVVMQLRNFMVGSMHSQMIQNTKRMYHAGRQLAGDVAAGNMSAKDGALDSLHEMSRVGMSTFGQIASGVLMYIAMVEITEPNMSDEKREKVYSMENLILAGISRSGWLAGVPFLVDTLGGAVGAPAKFDGFRSSGLGESLFTPPITKLPQNIAKGAYTAGKAVYQGDIDQKQALDISKALTNAWYLQSALNHTTEHVFNLPPPARETMPPDSWINSLTSETQ